MDFSDLGRVAPSPSTATDARRPHPALPWSSSLHYAARIVVFTSLPPETMLNPVIAKLGAVLLLLS